VGSGRRVGRAALVALLGAAALLLAPLTAAAQQTYPEDQLRILSVFKTITFGEGAFITGQLRRVVGPDVPSEPYVGRGITLEQSPFPYVAGWTTVATTVTDAEGYYDFRQRPDLNTRYRVRSEDPPLTSVEKVARVRFAVRLRLSDTTPAKGDLVEFSGTVVPAHHGGTVYIQRQSGATSWKTVTRGRLRFLNDFTSAFRRRVRVHQSGVFRVRVESDGAHLAGTNGEGRRIEVHEKKRR
jgi:hypothetical protein